MVKTQTYGSKNIFVCESCGFGYVSKELAKRCEDYCTKNHSCSLEITKYAVKTQ